MDLETLQFRAAVMSAIRDFFTKKQYLELDTPALSTTLIPETCLEVFKTEYIEPWSEKKRNLYLVPSPEIFIKKIIAEHGISVFQLSKCYRNIESYGRIHSPEFTMLEYYTMNASYMDSARITESFMGHLAEKTCADDEIQKKLEKPFTRISMDEAFYQLAGFTLSECEETAQLAEKAEKMGLSAENKDWNDLYQLIFVHKVEPNLATLTLPEGLPVFLTDYPGKAPCLAKDKGIWKERWELYVAGTELANCYSEETDANRVKEYFLKEGLLKNQQAIIPHSIDENYWKNFENFPDCSGVALGVDRLLMILAGKKSIESLLPFYLEKQKSF